MKSEIVVSCFDYTTNMAKPWAKLGYLCYCVDIQHPPGETREGNIVRVGADIFYWLPPAADKEVKFASFFPPCTNTAVSAARWFKEKGLKSLIEALTLFQRAVELAEMFKCPYLIENPVSTVATYYRKPDYTFDPYEYAGYRKHSGKDAYTKKTCLWTGGGFRMPKPKRVDPVLGSKMHVMPPSEERANLRSATPLGFAIAVCMENSK